MSAALIRKMSGGTRSGRSRFNGELLKLPHELRDELTSYMVRAGGRRRRLGGPF